MALAELSGLLHAFTEDDLLVLDLLPAMDLLSSVVLSCCNWPAGSLVTAYSESVALNATSNSLSFPLFLTRTHARSFSSVTVASYILYLYLHRKHVCKEGQRASIERFAYAAVESDRESVSPLIHSLSKVRAQTRYPVQTHTHYVVVIVKAACASYS